MEPKVSGLSPKTGPPGTKITIRGENLGQSSDDIISLTINGADCLPYLDWKSSTKITTRCTRTMGSGDIIITTHSGGIGTCDVQFECYEEVYGLTEESAVWVDEGDFFQAQEKEGSTKPSGLSDDYSMMISSSRFKPELFLQHNFINATLEDLEQLRKKLQADLAIKSDSEMSSSSNRAILLKSNLPAIMECLQILKRLNKNITVSRDTSTESIVRAIKDNRTKTHELFDPLLAQKDLVQSIESTMQVFRQNETLFNLPSAIESSIKTKDYDSVVKEISSVLAKLETINIEQSLVRKIRQDVTTKVQELRATIEKQLHQSCQSTTSERSIDEIKKLISHLNRLGDPINFDIWIALEEISESLVKTLSERYNHFLKLSIKESENSSDDQKLSITKSPSQNQIGEPPAVVQFVQSAITIFHNTYYDILALGQSYFDPKDEFACSLPNEIRQTRLLRFEETMVSVPVAHLCSLLKSALVPDSEIPSEWPSNESTQTYATWLKRVLQSVISCHIHLTKVNLPPTVRPALDDFKQFVFDLRVSSMKILFGNATRFNKNLHHKEDWMIRVDDLRGGTTKLPLVFEKNVLETLRFANETIFTTSLPNEKSILIGHDVKASIKESVQSLINSFIDSLDNALIDSKEHPAESTRILMASREHGRVASNYTDRLLITICNCKYTEEEIFVRLQDEFEKLPGLKMDRVFKNCSKKYCDYINKISEKFCRIKCAEVKRSLKEAKSGHFEELQINLMIINSQIFLIAPQFVNNLMTSIVNLVSAEQSSVQKL